MSPVELMECCVRLGVRFEKSVFRRAVEGSFVRWAKEEWLRIATARQFSLAAPRITAPAIAEAAQSGGDDLHALAVVLRAALLGTTISLPAEMADWIRTNARS